MKKLQAKHWMLIALIAVSAAFWLHARASYSSTGSVTAKAGDQTIDLVVSSMANA